MSLNHYDAIPYDSSPLPQTHPNHLASLGYLYGLPVTDPECCRVLELGSGNGGNLIPMAWYLPSSHFVGVELAPAPAAAAQSLATTLGLSNIQLLQADLMALSAKSLGSFDYVIAHGLWSWVPESVRQQILILIGQVLNPGGVALVSYNTLPGWRMRGMLRDMLGYHTRHATNPEEQFAQTENLMQFLSVGLADLDTAHARYLKAELVGWRQADRGYLYHEYLEPDNTPVLFSDFVKQAQQAGLGYVTDADLASVFPETLGESGVKALYPYQDRLEREQYADFLCNRNFRQSLLCRTQDHPLEQPDPARFQSLAFYADLLIPPKLDLRRAKAQMFRTRDGVAVEVIHPLTKAALMILVNTFPNAMTFDALHNAARQAVTAAGATTLAQQSEHLVGELFNCYAHHHCWAELRPQSLNKPYKPVSHPQIALLGRAQLAAGHRYLSTPRHVTMAVDEFARALADKMDGTATVHELVSQLVEAISIGQITLGSPRTLDKKNLTDGVVANVNRLLVTFARQGLVDYPDI